MSSEILYELSAEVLTSRYGLRAADEAGRRAEVSRAQGDEPGKTKWLLVRRAIQALKGSEAGRAAE